MKPSSQTTKALSKHWGGLVRARRRLLGLTQGDLANLCEVTQPTISYFETGSALPTDQMKILLAMNLGIAPGELFPLPTLAEIEVAA